MINMNLYAWDDGTDMLVGMVNDSIWIGAIDKEKGQEVTIFVSKEQALEVIKKWSPLSLGETEDG